MRKFIERLIKKVKDVVVMGALKIQNILTTTSNVIADPENRVSAGIGCIGIGVGVGTSIGASLIYSGVQKGAKNPFGSIDTIDKIMLIGTIICGSIFIIKPFKGVSRNEIR